MQNQKQIGNQNNVNSIYIKKISTLTKIHFIFGIVVFLFWTVVIILSTTSERPGGSDGLGFLIFIPFIYANVAVFFVSVIISISILVESRNKKVKVLNIISTILISTILIILYPVNYLKENVYDKYLKTVKSCEKENSEHWRSYCYYSLAIDRNDISICYYIPETNANDWRNACIWLISNNINLCHDINDIYRKDECIFISANTVEQCIGISESSKRDECIWRKANNIDQCKMIKEFYLENCLDKFR